MTNPGTATITANVVGPGGGTSNADTFTITPATTAQNALHTAARQNRLVDSNPKSSTPAMAPPRPMRFLGSNYGRTVGAAYLKYFSRPYGGAPIPTPNPAVGAVGSGPMRMSAESPMTPPSLSQPASLPGFAFHPN